MSNKVGLLRFGAVGVVNTIVDFAIFITLVRYFEWNLLLANAVSYLIAVSNSYVLNLIWTFTKSQGAKFGAHSYLLFVTVNTVGFLIGSVVIWLLQDILIPEFGKLLSITFTLVWNYFATKRFVIESGKLSEQ